MKILVVDNGTTYLQKLLNLVQNHQITVVGFEHLSQFDISIYQAIILSGGHQFSVVDHDNKYKTEIDIVRHFNGLIIGICLGFELIAHAFGAVLEKLKKQEKGIIDIFVSNSSVIFEGISNFQVAENHRWVVKKLSNELVALAESTDGIEVIRHYEKPIFGFQFHPELFVDKTCGDEIFKNTLSIIESVSKEPIVV